MRIVDIETRPVDIDYLDAYQHDRRFYPKPPSQTNVLVIVTAEDGSVGYGEAAHSPGIYGDTAGATEAAIAYLKPHLVGADVRQLAQLEVIVDRMSPIGNVSAKAGLDIALHDLAGKVLGVPVYQLLGGRVHERVPTHMSPATYEGTASDLEALVTEGYRFFKQKMSGDTDYDIELVRSLLPLCSEGVTISLDANQGWSLEQALLMARMIEREPDYRDNVILEQPILASDIKGLAYLRGRTPLTVLADDSIRTMPDLLSVIEHGAADLVSLKISRVGGIRKCARMIAVAESYNVPYIVDEINEMRIANTAVAHLAIASKAPKYCGVTCHKLLVRDIVTRGGVRVVEGCAVVGDDPGLGISELDDELVGAAHQGSSRSS